MCWGRSANIRPASTHGAATTLAEAEERALAETVEHAGAGRWASDPRTRLRLGFADRCGWREHFPAARITAVSNSASQRAYIEARRRGAGLANLRVITADMNVFAPDRPQFDRIVSVEMFEHMIELARAADARVAAWLQPDGRFFMHIFTHRAGALSLRPRRRGGLDRAAFLHRRHHAEP